MGMYRRTVTNPRAEISDGLEGNWGRVPPSARAWEEQLLQMRPTTTSPALPLTAREELVATLFVDGHTIQEASEAMGISAETVHAYLVRAQLKFHNAGREAPTALELRQLLIEDGVLKA